MGHLFPARILVDMTFVIGSLEVIWSPLSCFLPHEILPFLCFHDTALS